MLCVYAIFKKEKSMDSCNGWLFWIDIYSNVYELKGVIRMSNELKPHPFEIGDVVYILGKYLPLADAPLLLLECKISHIQHRQFVAYRTDGETGVWKFSRKDYNKAVFKDKSKAEAAWNGTISND